MSDSAFKNPFDVIDEDETDTSSQAIHVLPQEIEQALKKISKRDSTTRSKGFQELLEFLRRANKGELQRFTPLIRAPYIKIFRKFVFCADKSTRIAVSELSNLLITKSDPKIFLQPILKEIICVFLMSLFDPANEVSALQRVTLESVFPGKLKALLEKFDQVIRIELWEYAERPQKFEELKDILREELEATDEEYNYSVELVKTEIVGLYGLLGRWEDERKMRALLFISDKAFSTFRRCALYRFALKFQEPWFESFIYGLLVKENNPTALSVALDLLDKTESEKYKSVLSSEKFVLSFISSAGLTEFKRFSVSFRGCLNSELLEAFCDSFLRICEANTMMNKERFMTFWKEIAGPLFASSPKRDFYLKSLLLPERNSRNLGALTTFTPLNAEETIKIVCDVFSRECLVGICGKYGGSSRQSAFVLAYLKSYEELEGVMANLSLTDLQLKELIKYIPNEMMTRRLIENSEDLSASELIRLIQSCLSVEDAVQVLKSRKFNDWDRMLKSAYITKASIKSILFQVEGFLEYARNKKGNKTLVSCAFESDVDVFGEDVIDPGVLEDAVGEVEEFCLKSPLLKNTIFLLLDSPKIHQLLRSQPRELYESLRIQEDCAKFLSLGCEIEDFFPVWYFDEMLLLSYEDLPKTPEECLVYEPEYRRNDEFFEDLIAFKFEGLDNRIKAAKCAFLNRVSNVHFNFNVEEMENIAVNGDVFGLFCASKYLNESLEISTLSSFKDALTVHKFYSSKESKETNVYFDSLVFSEKASSVHVAYCFSLEPVLNIRSDILNGLFSDLLEAGEVRMALIAASKHLNRSDLSDEFWRSQFRDHFRAILCEEKGDELGMLVASGFWSKIEGPAEEAILKEFKETIKASKCIGACRLISEGCLWMKEEFSLQGLIEYFEGDERTLPMDLAMRNVYVRLHLDEQLVAASVKLKSFDESRDSKMSGSEIFAVLFPFYERISQGDAIIFEMFASAAEGCKEDLRLFAAFAEAFQQFVVNNLVENLDQKSKGDDFGFDFTPRFFDEGDLWRHVGFRFSCLFPLVVGPEFGVGRRLLKERVIERLKRQPMLSLEENKLEICLKPILSSTTQRVELKVRFADEIELLIGLKLGDEFPFEPVQVEGLNKSGLSEAKWRSALLSLQVLLRSPTFSGNLVEVVQKWQQNALKLFQGLEECAVCYSVLHGSDKSLPGPACKQCKHKFHASCLYKWFKSSGNATCPLCRSLF